MQKSCISDRHSKALGLGKTTQGVYGAFCIWQLKRSAPDAWYVYLRKRGIHLQDFSHIFWHVGENGRRKEKFVAAPVRQNPRHLDSSLASVFLFCRWLLMCFSLPLPPIPTNNDFIIHRCSHTNLVNIAKPLLSAYLGFSSFELSSFAVRVDFSPALPYPSQIYGSSAQGVINSLSCSLDL